MTGTSTCTTGRFVRTAVTTPETCGVSDMITALGVSRSVIAGNGVPSLTRIHDRFEVPVEQKDGRARIGKRLLGAIEKDSEILGRQTPGARKCLEGRNRMIELAIDHACQVLRNRLNAKLELLPLQRRRAAERNSRQEEQGKPQGCGKEDKTTAKRPRCAQSRGDMRPPDRSV